MANKYKYLPLLATPGIDKDNTSLRTVHYTDGSNIRFYDGLPRKLGGNAAITFDNSNSIRGYIRTIYSQRIDDQIHTLIGTNTCLYTLVGTTLTNITPLVTSTTALGNNPLASHYQTLGASPVTTVSGSATLTIASTAHVLVAGDVVTLAGAATTNGVPDTEINAAHIVRSTATNSYTIMVSTTATSSGSGGGAGVTEASKVVTVTQNAHGFTNGDRILMAGVGAGGGATGGIPDADFNKEHIIRNKTTNTYDIVVATTATASETDGGAAVTVRGQIAAGNANGGAGIGFGMWRFGTGKFGIARVSTANIVQPRIWSFTRYGANVLMSPGGQTGVYSWGGDTEVAPALLTNAPTAVEYVFQSQNIIATLGQGGVENRVKWSDQGFSTVWTGTSQNQASDDDIEGADQFISHASARNGEILFTDGRQMVLMQYVGRPLVWKFTLIELPDGLIGRNARISVNGVVYWMGNNNFWEYNGGVIRPLQSNSETGHNYVRRHVFDDINTGQKSKCFAWYNPLWDELNFHYPSANSNEPDKVVRYSLSEKHFTPDDSDRSAAESPLVSSTYPRLAGTNNSIYRHDFGVNNNGSALDWSLTFPLLQIGNDLTEVGGIIPDSTQTGSILLTVKGLPYAQSASTSYAQNDGTADTTSSNFTITPTTGRIGLGIESRCLEVALSQSSVTDGDWIMGQWNVEVARGSERTQ